MSWEMIHPLAPAVLEERALPMRPKSSVIPAVALFIILPVATEAFLLPMPRIMAALLAA